MESIAKPKALADTGVAQSGSALIAALFLAMLLSLFSLYVLSSARLLSQTKYDESFSVEAAHKASQLALLKLVSGGLPLSDSPYVISQGFGNAGHFSIQRNLFAFLSRGDMRSLYALKIEGARLKDVTLFPRIDYNFYFEKALSCYSVLQSSHVRTLSGFKLTPGSAVNRWTCDADDTLLSEPKLSNIYSKRPLSFNGGTLAATGYIDVKELKIHGDSLIIAGGDLRVSELDAGKFRLTLISATGRMEIGNIHGNPSLKVIAYETATGPFAPAGDNMLYPRVLARHITGYLPASKEP